MRPTTRRWLWAAGALPALAAALLCVGAIREQRQANNLVLPPAPKTVRPSLLLTPLLALGRAPIVDYLWLRATTLKDEGRFFDAFQLSQMICELQPKFASVWAFQGWNMAYNISVTLKSPEERWRWVRNGYELIRDNGIPLNPHNTQLYRELAWIFFHKVGDFSDELHYYYKLQLALQMQDILGPPPEGFVGPGRVAGDFYREYDYVSLAQAPERFETLIADREVADLVRRLEKFGYDCSRAGDYLGLLAHLRSGDLRLPKAPPNEEENLLHELREVMADPKTADARQRLERFWRAQRLRTEVKLEPETIVRINDSLGVILDFRLAESHALYWASLGMQKGLDLRANVDIHRLNTNRIEFFCLQKMFHRGRLEMSPAADLGEPPLLSPDIRFVPILFETYRRDSKEYLTREHERSEVSVNFRSGFIAFMRSAILRYNELGLNSKAEELLEYLRKNFPDPVYDHGLDYFLADQFKVDRELNDHRVALARIEALAFRGLLAYAYGEDEQAVRFLARAKQVYQKYQAGVVSNRLRIPFRFEQIVERLVHERCGQMYRASYERVCKMLGLTPLPPGRTTAGPAPTAEPTTP